MISADGILQFPMDPFIQFTNVSDAFFVPIVAQMYWVVHGALPAIGHDRSESGGVLGI